MSFAHFLLYLLTDLVSDEEDGEDSKNLFSSAKGWMSFHLTLKAQITTAADNKFCDIFPYLKKKIRYDIS